MQLCRIRQAPMMSNIRWVEPSSGTESCPSCPKSFGTHKSLEKHLKSKHGKPTGRKYCLICGKSFKRPCDRERHELTHSVLVDPRNRDPSLWAMGRLDSFDHTKDRLMWSYIHDLAPSRTLSKAQDLFMQLLPIAVSFQYLYHSILSVTGSYLKHEITDNATLHWRLLAVSGLKQRLGQIQNTNLLAEMKPILGCTALLLQYAVKNTNLHEEWCDMVRGLGPLLIWAIPFRDTLAYRMRLAAHHVLANILTSSEKQFPSAQFLHESEEGVQEIDGSIGASPQVLNMIQRITICQNKEDANVLLQELELVEQFSSEPDIDDKAREIICDTAETYRLTALIYVNCRFPGTLSNANVRVIANKLLHLCDTTLANSPRRVATHNLCAVVICAVVVSKRGELERKVLSKMEHDTESNVCPAVRLIRDVLWKTKAIRFEDVAAECGIPSLT